MQRKNAQKQIFLICEECKNPFPKLKKEYDRQKKNGKECRFCNRKCSNRFLQRRDKNEPFRFAFTQCKRSAKSKNLNLDISWEYLKEIWASQNGRCAYTKVEMTLPTYKHEHNLRKASVDRIDPDKGYERGNIEWVTVFVNLGKNGFSKDEVLSLLEDSKNNMGRGTA